MLATLTDDCTVIECYGPIYNGRERVEQWMNAWFAADGTVDSWIITSMTQSGNVQIAEWTFTCTLFGRQRTFDGITIAHIEANLIHSLREYATTAPLYEWTGTWRA